MRILRLKLVNFIGIKNGTGKDEIEINFPKNDKIITSICGGNGKGKSTIMSMLTPFKDSFDIRKSLILPGKEGIKEIDYEHDGHVYKIKHIYGAKAFSFISEDGIELNENGGVRTFEDIVKVKFKLTKDYFKIGKLGSNTENFIQYTTAQRKAYISTFVEEVQKYIDAYEVVMKKVKFHESQIKQISADMQKFDDSETINFKIETETKKLDELNQQVSTLATICARLAIELTNLEDAKSKIDYVAVKNRLYDSENKLKKFEIIEEKFKTQYAQVQDIATEKQNTDNKIHTLKQECDRLENERIRLDESIIEAQNEIYKVKSQLNGKTQVQFNILKADLERLKQEKQTLESAISADQFSPYILKDVVMATKYLDSFSAFMKTILSQYSILNDNTIDKQYKNCELFFMPDFSERYCAYAHAINKSLALDRDCLENKTAEYSQKAANIGKLDILEKRPHECKIDNCPFIADALQYKDLPQELVALEELINGVKNSIKVTEEQADKMSDIKITYSEIAKDYRAMNPRDNVIFKYFIMLNGRLTDFLQLPVNEVAAKITEFIANIENLLQKINSLSTLDNKIELAQTSYEHALETEENRIYFQNILNEQTDKYNSAQEKRNQIVSEKNTKVAEFNNLSMFQKDLTDFADSLNEKADLCLSIEADKKLMNEYETLAKEYSSKLIEKQQKDSENDKLLSEIQNLTEDLVTLKANSVAIANLKNNLDNLNSSFTNTAIVRDALNPKSGIPLIFIQAYLDGTEAIANELLKIAYGDKFEIHFKPTENDFFIQVRAGENIIEDIKAASQGEISLTTISISLALIERAIGDYNILYLDEIDGPLDSNNRELFIDILDKQIENLGLEQIFVISHNNAFEACNMNLILLPEHSVDKTNPIYMQNKNIIFEI